MKQVLYVLSIFSLIAFVPASASAQCVQSDVSVQASISGSSTPIPQQSNVQMNSSGPCTGNHTHTGGVQIRVGGTAPGRQTREVDQQIHESTDSHGISGTTVQTRSNPSIDVYNPADRF